MSASNYIHLDNVEIVAETEKAFLLNFEQVEEEGGVWIPKSQIADPGEYSQGDKGVQISITKWIAEQKGIEEEEK